MLYNVPVRARSPIHLETVKALAQYDQIIGIKDSSGSFNFVQELIGAAETLPNFAVFQGDEQAMGAAVLLGADGIVPVSATLTPSAVFSCTMLRLREIGKMSTASSGKSMMCAASFRFHKGPPMVDSKLRCTCLASASLIQLNLLPHLPKNSCRKSRRS